MERMWMNASQSPAGLELDDNKQRKATAAPSHDWPQAHRELWQRLALFEVDDAGASFPLSARLAREQGWTRAFAKRVVDEYKKFLFLGCISPHPVTPSEAVDAAWHLHMIYTRSYWDELCANVLQRPFHLGPTKGGVHESAKFHDWYAKTLSMYERVFGVAAPSDIWPCSGQRFAARARWVDANTHWIVPKYASKQAGGLVGVGLASLAMAGCGMTLAQHQASKSVVLVVVLVIIVLITILLALWAIARLNRPKNARQTRRGRHHASTDGFTPMYFFGDSGISTHHGNDRQSNDGTEARSDAAPNATGVEMLGHHDAHAGHNGSDASSGDFGGDAGGGSGGGGDGGGGCGGGGCGGGD